MTFLNARHGDSCLLTWPGANRSNAMLVDGGPADTYEQEILPHLTAMGVADIDVICVTHVDDDHIVGILRLLLDIDRARTAHEVERLKVRRLWFNHVEDLVDDLEPGLSESVRVASRKSGGAAIPASLRQGDQLRQLSIRLGLTGNRPFNGLVRQGVSGEVSGLQITVVAPDEAAIGRLAAFWRRARECREPGVVAAAITDRSVPNLSSISLHLRHGPRSILLTGDARGDRVVTGLAAVTPRTGDGLWHLDVLQVPHHGSDRNVDQTFFQRIRADHYVISTDGRKHDHPSEQTLHWLVGSRSPDDRYTVHFTNPVEPALTLLRTLRNGRAFTINARTETLRAIRIAL